MLTKVKLIKRKIIKITEITARQAQLLTNQDANFSLLFNLNLKDTLFPSLTPIEKALVLKNVFKTQVHKVNKFIEYFK